MIDDADFRRLARHFGGEETPDEHSRTAAWLDEVPGRRDEADRLRALWAASDAPSWTPNVDAAWSRVATRLHVGEPQERLSVVAPLAHPRGHFTWRRSPTRSRAVRWTVGGMIAAAAVSFVVARQIFEDNDKRNITAATSAAKEFKTARGQRAIVVLGDGSRVELGAESVLWVKEADSAGRRVVVLEGLAVFDVVHDSIHPFEVRSANAITEDLGTRFTVRAYPNESRVQVFVASGSVALRAVGSPSTSGTLLGPRDLGVLDSLGRATVKNGVDSTSHLAWTAERFVFDNMPLADVLSEVGRWYDVKIVVADPSLLEHRITLNMSARSLSDVIAAITTPLRLRSTKRGSDIVIR